MFSCIQLSLLSKRLPISLQLLPLCLKYGFLTMLSFYDCHNGFLNGAVITRIDKIDGFHTTKRENYWKILKTYASY